MRWKKLSTEQEEKKGSTQFETHIIGPSNEWFDPVGIRFFINATQQPLKLGFSHNIRSVEMIAIFEPTKEDLKSEEIKALEGEIIEEEE